MGRGQEGASSGQAGTSAAPWTDPVAKQSEETSLPLPGLGEGRPGSPAQDRRGGWRGGAWQRLQQALCVPESRHQGGLEVAPGLQGH